MDVAAGDLDAVLGGISETVYENTVSIAQLKSTTGVELVREVQNYMASYQGAGDSSVDLGRTMQMLKMSRKGYQVQADKKKKEIVGENDEDYFLIKQLDYYSKLLEMNKPIDPKKVIHTNNYLSIAVKKESIVSQKLTPEIIENYFQILSNPILK